MKNAMPTVAFTLLSSLFLLSGCGGESGDDTTNADNTANDGGNSAGTTADKPTVTKFLAFQSEPRDDISSKHPKLIIVDDQGTSTVKAIDESIYPPQGYGGRWDFIDNSTADGNYYVMTLHEDFNNGYRINAALVDINKGTHVFVPLPPPRDNSHFTYYRGGSGRIDGNNHVFYISVDHHKAYSDDTEFGFLRYNIPTSSYKQAISCNSFILEQPEKGDDTEACWRHANYVPSTNGRYIYGEMEGWGVDGGVNHYDYTILYQYDFDSEKYTRLGGTDDNDVAFVGATADRRNIVYRNGNKVKVYNIDDRSVRVLDNVTQLPSTTARDNQWNNSGAIASTTAALYFSDIVSDRETMVIDKRVDNEQLSEDGSYIYFTLHGDPSHILYKTKDLSENSPYEKVAKLGSYDKLILLTGEGSGDSSQSGDAPPPKPDDTNEIASCLYDDDLYDNCIDGYPIKLCTAEHLFGATNTPVTNNQNCETLGYELSIINSEGYHEYFKVK